MTQSAAKLSFDRVAIIGIGLIGSSLARSLRLHEMATHIAISDQSQEHLDQAEALALGDSYSIDPAAAAADADVVVLCTPISAYEPVMKALATALKPGAIVTDVGSVKKAVIDLLSPLVPDNVHLVPAHPVAGTEQSGPASGFPALFDGRWCVITPTSETDQSAIDAVTSLWSQAGSMVEMMDAAHHDQVMAVTSHLPHLIAYTIVGTATDLEKSLRNEVIKFSASGFRDFTRIAASDPTMWRDVFMNNRDAVLEILQRFNEDLTALQRAIRWGEADTLYDLFDRTREIRRRVVDAKQA